MKKKKTQPKTFRTMSNIISRLSLSILAKYVCTSFSVKRWYFSFIRRSLDAVKMEKKNRSESMLSMFGENIQQQQQNTTPESNSMYLCALAHT